MILTLIAACDRNGVIGRSGGIPWEIPSDLEHFRERTMGHPLLVGRVTWQEIGRPLPGRTIIVVTRGALLPPPGVVVVDSLEKGIGFASSLGSGELFIAGGESIYRQTIDRADRLLITEIDASFDGDRFFPPIDPAIFEPVSCRESFDGYPLRFVEYRRRTS